MGHDGHDHHHHHDDHHHGHSHTAEEHKAHAPVSVSGFVVTCSDTRNEASDETGKLIRERLEGAGHSVVGHRVVKDDEDALRSALDAALAEGARAIFVNGGTGIARRDTTLEVLEPLFEKRIPGFGELFRYLSFKDIGSPAMLSRAAAGTYRGSILFALPGSPAAVSVALDQLILPELGHLVRELMR